MRNANIDGIKKATSFFILIFIAQRVKVNWKFCGKGVNLPCS